MGLVPPPPPPRQDRPPAAVGPPLNPRSVFIELVLAAGLLIGLVLLFPSCATLSNSQPVKLVCASCALLSSSGVCGSAALKAMAPPTCPKGQELWIVNYSDVMKNGAAPKFECRWIPR